MVLLSFGAQVIETIFVRGTVFVVETTASLGYWLGSSIYHYYYPRLSEIEFVKLELDELKKEMEELKEESVESGGTGENSSNCRATD
jgi:hypothetical protein